MLRWLAVAFALTVAALPLSVAASATRFRTSADGVHSARHGAGTALRSGAVGRAGETGAGRPAAASAPLHFGSHDSGGWYQRGFGGNRDPGWGYGFGPPLGGFGR
jgi:hypothetical protein